VGHVGGPRIEGSQIWVPNLIILPRGAVMCGVRGFGLTGYGPKGYGFQLVLLPLCCGSRARCTTINFQVILTDGWFTVITGKFLFRLLTWEAVWYHLILLPSSLESFWYSPLPCPDNGQHCLSAQAQKYRRTTQEARVTQ